MSTLYGKTAYEGFAKAFGAKLGVSVTVTDGTNACVNEHGVIQLPGMSTYQTITEFEDTCATIVHEVSHVYYDSHEEFSRARLDRLYRDCLNAVLDVADETGISDKETAANNPRPQRLLERKAVHVFNERQRELTDDSCPIPHWQILATGILKARVPGRASGRRFMGQTLVHRYAGKVDVKAILTTLQGARKGPRVTGNHKRQIRMAEKLYKLLLPLTPPPNAEEPKCDAQVMLGKGYTALPSGCEEATAEEGAEVINAPGGLPSSGAGGRRGNGNPSVHADMDAYNMLLPSVKRLASRMADDGEAVLRDGGYRSGTSVMDAYRTITDGQCMGRWNVDPHADGLSVAVLLDCSGSMGREKPAEVMGVAEAFSTGMEACAEVKRWAFGEEFGPDPVYNWQVPTVREVQKFENLTFNADTPTHRAIDAAIEWLKGREGKRLIVCITDGLPDEREETATNCMKARSLGISVVGIGYAGSERYMTGMLHETMPGATIVWAEDHARLAIQLDTIGHQLAC